MLKKIISTSLKLNSPSKFVFSTVRDSESSGKNALARQYDPTKHTLLEDLFTYNHTGDYLSYLIYEKKTNSLVAIDPGPFSIARENIELVEYRKKAKLTHVFVTHHHKNHNGENFHLNNFRPDAQIIIGNYGELQSYSTLKLDEIKPVLIGDLSICFFHTPGHTKDSSCIVVTQINADSTKTPLLFTGDTLFPGSCGPVYDTYTEMYQSLTKLKSLPNETLIFPGHETVLSSLIWAKTFDPNNQMLNLKIELAEQMKAQKQMIMPTTILDEKYYNPFMRCTEKYYRELVKENDPVRIFTKLKKAQEAIFKL